MVYVVVVILLTIVLASTFGDAAETKESQSFVSAASWPEGLGLVITLPIVNHCFKISLGDQSELMTYGWARFKNREMPVQHHERIPAGSRIKVSVFAEAMVHVMLDPDQQ